MTLIMLFISSLSNDSIALKSNIVIYLFLSSFLVYTTNKYLIQKVVIASGKIKEYMIAWSSFVGTLLFIFNPWTIHRIHHHPPLVLSVASTYTFVAEVDKLLSYFSIKSCLPIRTMILISFKLALLLMFIATQPQGLIIYLSFFLIIYIFMFLIVERKIFLSKIFNRGIAIIIVLILLLNMFWILPQFLTLISGITKPGSYGIVAENVEVLSRRASFLNVLRGANYFVWGGKGRALATVKYNLVISNINLWTLLSLMPAILSAISILICLTKYVHEGSKKYLLYIMTLFTFATAFSTGSYYPLLGDLYKWIFLNTPIGWALRGPAKNTGIVIVSMSALLSLLIVTIMNKLGRASCIIRKASYCIVVLIIITSILIWGWPALTGGDLNGHLELFDRPKDLEKVVHKLESEMRQYDFKENILWYPQSSLYRNMLTYEDIPELSTLDMGAFVTGNEQFNKYIEKLVMRKLRNELLQVFKRTSIKYIITRRDVYASNIKERERLLSLIKNMDIILTNYRKITLGNYTVYEISEAQQKINVHSRITHSLAPELSKDTIFNATTESLVVPMNNSLYIVCPCYIDPLLKGYVITLRPTHHQPDRYWSLGTAYGGWLKTFVLYLEKYNIENWQSDYSAGLAFTWSKSVTLHIPFEISKSDKYKFFIRYFENQKGGAIRIYFDGRLIAEIDTVSQLNRFVWRDLGTFSLEPGKHVLTLKNIKGFNAVNIFILISVDEYNELVKNFEELLENKTIVYLFEAESDMFREKAGVVKNINASNGEMLNLKPGGYAWQRFEIAKNGYYMVALRLNGSARIVVNNNSFTIFSNELGFYYLGPIYFEKGNYAVRVEALKKPLYLDVIWIYSTKSSSCRTTIEDLFRVKERPAKVIYYELVDPTLWRWRTQVVAKRAFMLVFAEAYDPLWEARVYRDGRLVESIKSISVYGVINGFWINETGNLTIVIRYVPQDWFELGLKVSAATFTACTFYLVWDWRRDKGDRRVSLLEKSVRRMFNHGNYE